MQSQGKRRRRLVWIISGISLVMLVVGVIAYFGYFKREHREWGEEINLLDGTKLRIHMHSSERIYYGNPVIGWGGGDPRVDLRFNFGGKEYRWEGPYIPLAIQPDQDHTIYMAVFDRESDNARYASNYLFRFYRSRGGSLWDEIRSSEFPKHLAVQNTSLSTNNGTLNGKVINEYEIVAEMDPGDWLFQKSLTAFLWAFLEQLELSRGEDPPKKFLIGYKAKWIQPPKQVDKLKLP